MCVGGEEVMCVGNPYSLVLSLSPFQQQPCTHTHETTVISQQLHGSP